MPKVLVEIKSVVKIVHAALSYQTVSVTMRCYYNTLSSTGCLSLKQLAFESG